VLIEENLAGAGGSKPTGARTSAAEAGPIAGPAYSKAALAAVQPPAVAILAARAWTLTVVSLAALTAFVGLLAAYGQIYLFPADLRPLDGLALDVETAGNLLGWLASVLLIAAAFQAAQIYRLRRHKRDDYRGRYRVWAWLPLVFFGMAACVATGLHRDAVFLLAGLIDPDRAAEHAALWPVGGCVLWTLVAVRLAFEIRSHRGSLALLAACTLCYFAAAAAMLVVVPPLAELALVMSRAALASWGHLSLFLMVAVFGRHVYLASQGLLQQTQKTKPRRRTTQAAASAAAAAATETAAPSRQKQHSEPQPAASDSSEGAENESPDVISLQAARPAQGAAQPSSESSDSSDDEEMAGVSKAERRRLRKMQRRDRRAA
jgi:hypothetical protein